MLERSVVRLVVVAVPRRRAWRSSWPTRPRVGWIRPITLWPFPSEQVNRAAKESRTFLVVEMSMGQMIEDVRLAVEGKAPVKFHGRPGGGVPTVEEILEKILLNYSKL